MYRLQDRFTRTSRIGRGKIPRGIRQEVFLRDNNTCQFCGRGFPEELLTVDHLIPIALGGLDEITNYATACRHCNEKKAATPLKDFAASLNIRIEALPVHGDPIIDNQDLPIQIRLIRKRIFDKQRKGELRATGKSAQKRTEKEYRRALWESEVGNQLSNELPSLPGHARAIVPEARTVSASEVDQLFLIELTKSANTRSLIGSVLTKDRDLWTSIERIRSESKDDALKKRIDQALIRFAKEVRRRNLSYPTNAPSPQVGSGSQVTTNV